MKRIGIITIVARNLGNRLQNYALQEYLKQMGFDVKTIVSSRRGIKSEVKRIVKNGLVVFSDKYNDVVWANFNKRISWDNRVVQKYGAELNKSYDYFVAGSDQIWNPNFPIITDREFLRFADPDKRISYAASIGVNSIPDDKVEKYKEYLSGFKNISVREQEAAKIVFDLTGEEIPVVLDPTMLFTEEFWKEVYKKSRIRLDKKYVLKYFLGDCSDKYREAIEKMARENNLEIIDVMDDAGKVRKDIGPAEFLYLIKNSKYVCTDSFHGSVFSILFHKQFFVFARPFQEGYGNMNSRIDTLLNMTNFKDRYITDYDMAERLSEFDVVDFIKADEILERERKKAHDYLVNAMIG